MENMRVDIKTYFAYFASEGNPGIDQHKSCSQSDVNYLIDETVKRCWSSIQSVHFLKYF